MHSKAPGQIFDQSTGVDFVLGLEIKSLTPVIDTKKLTVENLLVSGVFIVINLFL